MGRVIGRTSVFLKLKLHVMGLLVSFLQQYTFLNDTTGGCLVGGAYYSLPLLFEFQTVVLTAELNMKIYIILKLY